MLFPGFSYLSKQLTHVCISSPDFTKSQNCASDCQYYISAWMLNISNLACPESKLLTLPIIPVSPEQKTWSISKHLFIPRYSIRESGCFYLQNVSCIKICLIFLLLPMVQVTMVSLGLLLWPPNWSPCFCPSPPRFRLVSTEP